MSSAALRALASRQLLLVSGAATLLLMGGLGHTWGGLKPHIGVWEMAATVPVSKAVLEGWGSGAPEVVRANLRVDYAFIAAYVTFLVSLLARACHRTSGGARRAARLALALPPAAGLLDVYENVQLAAVLDLSAAGLLRRDCDPALVAVATAAAAASAKFLLLFVALVLGVGALVWSEPPAPPGQSGP